MASTDRRAPRRRRIPHAGPPLTVFCLRLVKMLASRALASDARRLADSVAGKVRAVSDLEGRQNQLRHDLREVAGELDAARRELRAEAVRLDLILSAHYGPRGIALAGMGLPQRRKPGPKRRRRTKKPS